MKWLNIINDENQKLAIETHNKIREVKTSGMSSREMAVIYGKIVEYPKNEVTIVEDINGGGMAGKMNPHLVKVLNEIHFISINGKRTGRNV